MVKTSEVKFSVMKTSVMKTSVMKTSVVKTGAIKANGVNTGVFVVLLMMSCQIVALPDNVRQQLAYGDCGTAVTGLESAARQDRIDAPYYLALCLMKEAKGNESKVERLLKQSAREGNPRAEYQLGILYVSQNREREARSALARAADKGLVLAREKIRQIDSAGKNKPTAGTGTGNGVSSLRQEILSGKEESATRLVEAGDIPASNRERRLCLLNAIQSRMEKLALVLTRVLTTSEINNSQGIPESPLHVAIRTKSPRLVLALLGKGADPLVRDSAGRTAVSYVIHQNNNEVNRIFSDAGYSRENLRQQQLVRMSLDTESPFFKWSLLHMAVAAGDRELIRELLGRGISPWESGLNKQSLLETLYTRGLDDAVIRVVSNGTKGQPSTEVMNRLVSNGTKGQPSTEVMNRLVSMMIEKDDIGLMRSLTAVVSSGTWVTDTLEQSLLWRQTEVSEAMAGLLIDWQGLDRRRSSDGRDLMMRAVERGNIGLFRALADRGFPLNQQDTHGRSLGWYLSAFGNMPMLGSLDQVNREAMIYNGIDSSLAASLRYENQALIKHLVFISQNINKQDDSGNTALMIAAKNHPEAVAWLLERQADYKLRNNLSLTALMVAVDNECVKCAQLLLEAGANINRRNSRGISARKMAEARRLTL